MPTYEYRCKACQSQIEIWFPSFSAAAAQKPVCTVCGSRKLKRLISSAAAVRRPGPFGAPMSHPSAPAPSASVESPRELARAMHQAAAGRNLGEEFKEVAARLDKGESPKAIEKSLRKRAGHKTGPH
jgi:putative FmdB family regulatory protein